MKKYVVREGETIRLREGDRGQHLVAYSGGDAIVLSPGMAEDLASKIRPADQEPDPDPPEAESDVETVELPEEGSPIANALDGTVSDVERFVRNVHNPATLDLLEEAEGPVDEGGRKGVHDAIAARRRDLEGDSEEE